MIQMGDITALSGYTLPPVDVVTGGSPCQDMSVAGPRRGMKHKALGDEEQTRSGLFMEQIRIIRELRDADRKRGRTGMFIRPRFMVWENVPGAFSSNARQDFRAVLEECVRIAEPDAPDIPCPEKWPLADCWYGPGWSVAYRVLDAQFWGVPQRRRRIALVCDFGGFAAPEILFIRKGVSGYPEPGGKATEIVTGTTADSINSSGGISGDDLFSLTGTLAAGFKGGQSKDGSLGWQEEISPTLNAGMSALEPTVYDARGNGDGKTVCTLTGDHADRVTDYTPILMNAVAVDFRSGTESDINGTLQAKSNGGYSVNYQNTVRQGAVVRRLTPLECERLQGFPDGWTDIGDWTDSEGRVRRTSDSARFRALGNSIALPPWKWVLKRIAAQYERDATLGSLFDGISGFPLIWEQINGHGSALWASEIEPFCVAVSKKHFGDSQTDQQGDLSEFLFRQISKQKSTRKINERLW